MVSAINNATYASPTTVNAPQTTPEAKAAASPKPAQSQPQPTATVATDTVQISSATQALQEAIEPRAQTAKEAGHGDRQAQRLLAKEAAAAKIGQ